MGADVVFTLSLETFDDVVRREFCRPPDRGLLALAQSPEVTRLAVVDAWRSWPSAVIRRRGLSSTEQVEVADRLVTRLRPRRLRRGEPTEVRVLEREYARYSRWSGRVLGLRSGDEAALVTYNPFVAAFADAPWIGRRVFVCRDDFASAPRKKPWWPAYRRAYEQLADRCDAVFAVSDELASRIAPGLARTLPNGIDAQLWSPERVVERPEVPYAVYAGTVERRVDLTLLAEVLKVVPRILVAGVIADEEMRRELQEMAGVEVLGPLKQEDLVRVVSGGSVGLIPHHDTPMTRAMSPLKMYEYLAAGLPVVATDLPPVADGGDRVWRCTTRGEWAGAVRAALAAGVHGPAERAEVIAQISWDARLAPVVEAAVS
ncbi:glycosyltransferase [Nocardioides flavescens]|uniref:Glycosyltransferase n=1 Tax=Nocardioides flavescens TaxID=2691959 RepID=A0A6L7EZH5_9ACTN|nr:glycosyltransferase [Nocardioides flavescens]MXG89965.1 glycosyltransferase [Nocardioides flavescens]